jgi:hypothetical protein
MKFIQFLKFFQNLSMYSIRFGAVSAGAASSYGYGSTKMMELLAILARQHS